VKKQQSANKLVLLAYSESGQYDGWSIRLPDLMYLMISQLSTSG